jgi:PleD family two-component response regulator
MMETVSTRRLVSTGGMGLKTMRERAASLNARLRIESQPDQGTRVHCRGCFMKETIRILVVDDHVVVRKGLIAVLETEPGFEIVGEAGNGAEAIRLARQLLPDVVLMDVIMPVMDGIEATRQIKQRALWSTFWF